ncbi:methyltransferase [Aureococcus anophagefferens]|nr:methyltransferase [Aureococcus anophagefferens]
MADGQINDGSSVQYGKTQYWDERYTEDPAQFDWYLRWAGLAVVVQKHVRKNVDTIVLGCGNSRMGADMIDDGYKYVDISLVVVKQMLETYKDSGLKGLKFIHGNACSLEFPDESFDGAIAGDDGRLMCGEGSTSNVYAMCHEVSRVLRPGGVFFVVSHDPGYLQYLDPEQANREFGWKVTVDQIPKPVMNPKNPAVDEKGRPLYHYVYICKKKPEHGAS